MKKRFALGMLGTFAVTAGAVLWLERLGRRWGASGDEVRAAYSSRARSGPNRRSNSTGRPVASSKIAI